MEYNIDKLIKFGCVQAILSDQINKKLIGEVLTICDASIGDAESRKAVKSLISQSFSRISRAVLYELNNLPIEEGKG